MRKIFRRAISNPGSSLAMDDLLKSNDPPSDVQISEIATKIQNLQDDFSKLTGKQYSDELYEVDQRKGSRASKKYLDAIERYKGLLHPLRRIPEELLHRIFLFVVSETNEGCAVHETEEGRVAPERRDLLAVSSVSRYWRSAAINHHILWTHLPPLAIPESASSLSTTNSLLKLYLSRSGTAPLTVGALVTYEQWHEQRDLVLATFPLLTDQCHRWEDATLYFPSIAAVEQLLSRVRGNVPMLKKLLLRCEGGSMEESGQSQLDYFADAPLLRDVWFCIPCLELPPGVGVVFPWSQLTHFNCELPLYPVYKDLIEAQPPGLRKLCYESFIPDPLFPTMHCTLPQLAEIEFFQSDTNTSDAFASHLDYLTLPALTSLTVGLEMNIPSETFGSKVLALIERSRCPLEILHMEGLPTGIPQFHTILSLSHTIKALCIQHVDGPGLLKLVLDPNAPEPVLPKLQRLRIHFPSEPGEGELDVLAFMCMLRSRTQAIEGGRRDSGETNNAFNMLKSVQLIDYDGVRIQTAATLWEMKEMRDHFKETPAPDTAGAALVDLAVQAEDTLHRNLYEFPASLKAYRDVDSMLRQLESLSFERVNSSIFMRRNIPWLLTTISNVEDGGTLGLGDRLLRTQSRTKKLLNKWKPFLLRDARACPYLWRIGRTTLVQWWPTEPDDEERLWKRITAFVFDNIPEII